MSKPIPYIWSQDSEGRAKADCGCTLEDSYEGYPAFWQCPLHKAAPELLEACKWAYKKIQSLEMELAGIATVHAPLEKAIAKAEGR